MESRQGCLWRLFWKDGRHGMYSQMHVYTPEALMLGPAGWLVYEQSQAKTLDKGAKTHTRTHTKRDIETCT